MDKERRKKINQELELIQTLGHLLQKVGESDAEGKLNGWALENAGKMILNSACEVREQLDEEKRK